MPARPRARPETSPHTRGKPFPYSLFIDNHGNIPAYAGKAYTPELAERICEKHPRIRGESWLPLRILRVMLETSPHTRGKPKTATHRRSTSRNIPAYAGKAELIENRAEFVKKHPRIRGESLMFPLLAMVLLETSPHTRGKPPIASAQGNPIRNIPAYAGKARRSGLSKILEEKHPRIRGESQSISSLISMLSETSPHTRGKPTMPCKSTISCGNIPAYAGKARGLAPVAEKDRKHPRIRGESLICLPVVADQ